MSEIDEQYARIDAIIAPAEAGDFNAAVDNFLKYLVAHLQLPCEVTGIEDFQWEERYVVGGWSPKEYKKLKVIQPSYEDRYTLVAIEFGMASEWMMHEGVDIAARVQRIRDGRNFVLGLSELKTTDETSPNSQLLDDYSVFFCNYR